MVRLPPNRSLGARQRAKLVGEIVVAYLRARRELGRAPIEQVVERLRAGAPESRDGPEALVEAQRLGWMVVRILKLLPGDTRCLRRSLVLTQLLARREIASRLVIGARTAPDFLAHAWVEQAGVPVLSPEGDSFSRLVEASEAGLARTTVFGLDVRSEPTLPFLVGATAAATGRELEVEVVTDDLAWPPTASLISDERRPDGSVNFQIEADPGAGYRIGGPRYGASVIGAGGARLLGSPGEGGMVAWQRLLIAQALPFAAVMRGLEPIHASAVATGAGAVAFSGLSGSGKTSLALALARRGATLLTDDVLVLEQAGEELLGHPGAPVTGVEQGEAERLTERGVELGEVLAADGREQVARVSLASEPRPLRAFFLLRRDPAGGEPRFEPALDPQLLLASTFNLVLSSPERLARLLEVCAMLARGLVERVVFGPGVTPAALAAAVEARLELVP